MFSIDVVCSDNFIDMPFSSQALYFQLSMQADNEGFVSSPKSVARMMGAKKEDIENLKNNNLIIPFDSGIIVIAHWLINNNLRTNRAKATSFVKEKEALSIENNIYILNLNMANDRQVTGNCQANDRQVTGNCPPSIVEYSIVENSIVENSIEKNKKTNETIPFQKIVDIYNSTCIKLPKVVRLTDNRKKAIKARYMEYEKDISIFETLFKKVNESDFLQGINGEWKANFDWLLKQQSMVKVLEDQYINKHNQKSKESELVKNAIFGQDT